MTVITDDPMFKGPRTGKHDATQRHIRGSSLSLVGRFLALAMNFAAQVLTVRALSKSDYGALAYALSIISLGSSLTVFGLDKTITRFVPIYHEQKDYDRMFGTIILMIGTLVSLGLASILLIFGFQGLLGHAFIKDKDALALTLILITLSPMQALQSLFGGLLAIFATPRAIFFRRHVLGPGLKLGVVLIVLLARGSVYLMGYGNLLAGMLSLVIYVVLLWRIFHQQGLFTYFNLRSLQLPIREIFGFSIPLLTTDVVFLLRNFLVVLILQYFYTTSDVATYRAAVPVAGLNSLVYESFMFLFMPTASRLFARQDRAGINKLYWQSATWIAIASFPIFALTFSLAQPLTLLLFGVRYSQSGLVLALLALGFYVNAALGFNAYTLRVYGQVRYIVVIDVLAMVVTLITSMVFIPRYGALGAALTACINMIAHNLLNQAGLALTTDIQIFEWRYLKTYLSIIAGGLGLWGLQWLIAPPVYVSFGLAALVSALLLVFNRTALNVAQTFPELLRLPLLRQLFGLAKTETALDEQVG